MPVPSVQMLQLEPFRYPLTVYQTTVRLLSPFLQRTRSVLPSKYACPDILDLKIETLLFP